MTSGVSTTTECCDSVATALPHREATSQRQGRTVLIAASRQRAPRALTTRLAPSAFQRPIPKAARRSASWERKEQRERADYSELMALPPSRLGVSTSEQQSPAPTSRLGCQVNAHAVTPFLYIAVAVRSSQPSHLRSDA